MKLFTSRWGGRCGGVTLVEMMVVVTIVAIFAAIGVPALSAFIARNRLITQTNDVLAAMQVARSEATRLNTSVTFCKVASLTATACQGGAGTEDWRFWAVLAPTLTEPVLRRGQITSPNISLRVSSNLASRVSGVTTNNAISFGSDSLARQTDGSTLMAGYMRICSADRSLSSNFKLINISGGARPYVDNTNSAGTANCTDVVPNTINR